MAQVVRGEGHFLGRAQTLSLMQTEYVYPPGGNRLSSEDWVDAAPGSGLLGLLGSGRVCLVLVVDGLSGGEGDGALDCAVGDAGAQPTARLSSCSSQIDTVTVAVVCLLVKMTRLLEPMWPSRTGISRMGMVPAGLQSRLTSKSTVASLPPAPQRRRRCTAGGSDAFSECTIRCRADRR